MRESGSKRKRGVNVDTTFYSQFADPTEYRGYAKSKPQALLDQASNCVLERIPFHPLGYSEVLWRIEAGHTDGLGCEELYQRFLRQRDSLAGSV